MLVAVTELALSSAECPLCLTLEVIVWYQPAFIHFGGYGETKKTTVHVCECGFLLTINTETIAPVTYGG